MVYLEQFLLVAVVHFLAVASPGPDFVIILKQSVRYDRQTAMWTSLGVATGILLHVTYSLVGIGLIIASDVRLFTLLKYIAACYFCYIAWHGLQAKKTCDVHKNITSNLTQNMSAHKLEQTVKTQIPSAKKAYFTGFLINGLNVKATLFFVSLFSVIIDPQTPFAMKLSYGLYMAFATAAWFIFLSYVLTQSKIRSLLQEKGYLIDRVMGGVLFLLAIQLVLSDLA